MIYRRYTTSKTEMFLTSHLKTQEMQECRLTKNDDHRRVCSAIVTSVRAAIRTADTLNIIVKFGPFQQCANVTHVVVHWISLEDTGLVRPARRIDDGITIVSPCSFISLVTLTSHVGVFVFAANNQSVVGRFHNCAEYACSQHSSACNLLFNIAKETL